MSVCQQNSNLIMRAHNTPVEEKTTVKCVHTVTYYIIFFCAHRALQHLLLITQDCSLYKHELGESKSLVQGHFMAGGVFVPPPSRGRIAPASNAISAHCSFDFALSQQPTLPGPIYLLTPRKVAIFEVCCEAIPRQVNFLIDETCDTGNGQTQLSVCWTIVSATIALAKPLPVCILTTAVARTRITP